MSRSGGIGRRTGFKIQRWQHRKGSSPFSGTREFIDPVWVYFFVFLFAVYFVINDWSRVLVVAAYLPICLTPKTLNLAVSHQNILANNVGVWCWDLVWFCFSIWFWLDVLYTRRCWWGCKLQRRHIWRRNGMHRYVPGNTQWWVDLYIVKVLHAVNITR